MSSFHDLGLAKPVVRAVSDMGYETPSPIQAQMIPTVLEGNDAIGIAQTGTGKTAAFLLPLMSRLSEIKGKPTKGKCDVLVLTPTRELASQITDNARLYGKHLKFATALIVGGARYEGQLRALAKGVNLIVATPGRLIDHLESGAADLSRVSFVVLDEADQMLDMGFVPAVRQIMSYVPEHRQTLMTSATMPRPVENLAKDLLNEPVRIAVSRESEPAKTVKQDIFFVDKPQKAQELIKVLEHYDWSKVLVFTRTKRGADKVQVQLIKAGFMAQSLHGDKSFGHRRHILEEFKSGEVPIMVATDLAGRGLDIDDVSLVINYDMPNVPESYVHRIGRTGRAGRKGTAVSLVDRSEKGYLRDIEALMDMSLRPLKRVGSDESAPSDSGSSKGGSSKGGSSKGGSSKGTGGKSFKKDGKSKDSYKKESRPRNDRPRDEKKRDDRKKDFRNKSDKPNRFEKEGKKPFKRGPVKADFAKEGKEESFFQETPAIREPRPTKGRKPVTGTKKPKWSKKKKDQRRANQEAGGQRASEGAGRSHAGRSNAGKPPRGQMDATAHSRLKRKSSSRPSGSAAKGRKKSA